MSDPLDKLMKLSGKAYIEINNRITGFFNAPETTKWHLKAEHCTHRGHFFEGENDSLEELIDEAFSEMIRDKLYETI